MARESWFSENGDEILFRQYVERIGDWRAHMAQGAVALDEAQQQAHLVAGLLREVEDRVDEETHELLTRTFVEWAVLQSMQMTLAVEAE